MKNYTSYATNFSPRAFWKKCKDAGADAGKSLLRKGLELFFAAQSGSMSVADKAKVYGALGYFVLPIDVVPDMLPGGYADDLAVVVYTYKLLADHIGSQEKAKARAKMKDWGM